jgi:hypothetical protein
MLVKKVSERTRKLVDVMAQRARKVATSIISEFLMLQESIKKVPETIEDLVLKQGFLEVELRQEVAALQKRIDYCLRAFGMLD